MYFILTRLTDKETLHPLNAFFFTAHGSSDLVFIGGTLNAQKYHHTCTILQRHVLPFIRSARDNMDYLRRKNIDVFRGGSRIPGMGGFICIQEWGFALLILSHFLFNIL